MRTNKSAPLSRRSRRSRRRQAPGAGMGTAAASHHAHGLQRAVASGDGPASMPLQRASGFYVESEGITGFLRHPFCRIQHRIDDDRTCFQRCPQAEQPNTLQNHPQARRKSPCGTTYEWLRRFRASRRAKTGSICGAIRNSTSSPWNVDSIFCFAAHFRRLPGRDSARPDAGIYHIEPWNRFRMDSGGPGGDSFEHYRSQRNTAHPEQRGDWLGSPDAPSFECPIIFNYKRLGPCRRQSAETQVGGGSSGIGESGVSTFRSFYLAPMITYNPEGKLAFRTDQPLDGFRKLTGNSAGQGPRLLERPAL